MVEFMTWGRILVAALLAIRIAFSAMLSLVALR